MPDQHYALSDSYGMYIQYTGRWGIYWYSEIPLFDLPRLNITEDGEVKIVPGEIYCRWRDVHDDICELEFTDERDLRAHYRDAHHLRCVPRSSASLCTRDNMHIGRWYYDTVRNRRPNWPLIGASGVVQPTSSTRPRSMSLPVRHTEFGYLILSRDDRRQEQATSGEEYSVQESDTLADDGNNAPSSPDDGAR